MKHIIKKGDIILIITLLVLSFIPEGIFYLTGNDASIDRTYAVIQVDGKVYKEVPLSGHHGTDMISIDTDKGHNLVVIQDESVGITEAAQGVSRSEVCRRGRTRCHSSPLEVGSL